MAKQANKISIDDVNVGDIASEMHLHQTNFGKFEGWNVDKQFDIGEDMFWAMNTKLDAIGKDKRPIGNKYARIIGINENWGDSTVDSVLVIYIYDHVYYAATLSMPK